MTERSTTTIAGLTTTYLAEGEGPTLLFLHGGRLGYSADSFAEVSPAFAAAGLRALAVDLPGYGGSDPAPDQSGGFALRFLREFITSVGGGRVHLVGHSNSGGNVVRIGLENPELAASVVIVGTGSLLPVTLAQAAGMRRELTEDDEPTEPPGIEETRASFAPDVFHAEALDKRVAALNEMARQNFEASRIRHEQRVPNHERNREGTPLWQRLDELTMPTMAIFGDGDKNRAGERLAALAERFPGVETHLLTQCRHVVHWDQPERFVELVADWVAHARM